MNIFRSLVRIQLLMAVGLCVCGIILLFSAFWVPPVGIIDSSVLVAFGELLTFVGALMGLDYRYRVARWQPPQREPPQ